MKPLPWIFVYLVTITLVGATSPVETSAKDAASPLIYDTRPSHQCFGSVRLTPRRETDQRPATDLWLENLETGEETCVVREVIVVDARLSGDGRFLAYVNTASQLHVVDTATMVSAGPVVKGVVGDLTWSPVGNSLLMSKLEEDGVGSDIFLLSEPGGELTRLTDNPGVDDRPVWSPDGGRVLFVSGRSGLASLWVMGRDGTKEVQLTNVDLRWKRGAAPVGFVPVPVRSRDVSWSGDGTVAYTVAERTLRLQLGR